MYDTILVGTDGSESAHRAVEHALERAEQNDATLHALFSVDTARYAEPALSSGELVTDEVEDWGQERLAEIVDRGTARGVEVVTRCCHGRPHEELIDYAEEIDADVTILGYQGQNHVKTAQVGSVTDRVVRTSDRPVLVV